MSSKDNSEASESAQTDGVTDAQVPQEIARLGKAYHNRRNVNIIVDSCADFAQGVAERLGVKVIEFSYVGPDGEHLDDNWRSQTPHEFYEGMRKSKGFHYTTAAVTPGAYLDCFEEAAKEGTPTLYLAFTAGLSSSFYAAEQAAQYVRDKHPDFELYVLDNVCPSSAAELLAIECVHQASMGLTARQLFEWARDARYFVHGYFTIDDMKILAAGGRIPPAAANIGGKLDVKPELSFDTSGSLTVNGMCRGRKKALRALVQEFRDNYSHDASLPIGIMSSDAERDADWLEGQIRKERGCEDITVIRSSIGPTLGAHVGPGMVAIVFWGTDRREKMSLSDRIAHKVRGGDPVTKQ